VSAADIILFAVNARYAHTSFGLRCLLANLGPLRPRARMREYDLRITPEKIADDILAENPRIAAAGVYIWNHSRVRRTMEIIRERNPGIAVIAGGPELIAVQECPPWADHVITGEADIEFGRLCAGILNGEKSARLIRAEPADTANISLPYGEYTNEDIQNRMIYVEASRGCPYRCEYCISSLDRKLRHFPQSAFFHDMEILLMRGARQFKFVDRAFNADIGSACDILDYFLARYTPGLRLHFEMMPDRFPRELRNRIMAFPPGALHLEIGIQTFNEEAAARIMRKTDFSAAGENLAWLRRETGALIHADLIAGLPGETMESIAAGFDRLVSLNPHELQFGILKKLPGAPIARHDTDWKMKYRSEPPYDILESASLSREQVEILKRFARFWDLFHNRGNFPRFMQMLPGRAESPFTAFMKFSQWLEDRLGRISGIPQLELYAAALDYMNNSGDARQALRDDYIAGGRRGHVPRFLKEAGTARRE